MIEKVKKMDCCAVCNRKATKIIQMRPFDSNQLEYFEPRCDLHGKESEKMDLLN